MIRPITLQEVQRVTGGELSGFNAAFNAVSIDTRTLQPDDLFVALSGPNFDGNKFVDIAQQRKAVAAIVSDECSHDLPVLKVKDTRIAFGQIAAMNRKASNACVIALTGSQGKTTVKEMVAEILANCGEVVYTQGNLNNDYGVPLSLLRINARHDYAVIELGASGPGEIAYSVGLTQPQVAHITNVAATHLEGFGDLDGVAQAKGELWDGLKTNGIAVINIDDVYAKAWCQRAKDKTIVTVSGSGKQEADYFVTNISFDNHLKSSFTLHTPAGSQNILLQLAGQHNVANALAAAALSMAAGAKLAEVRLGLEKIKAVSGRLCLKGGLNHSSIIDDSYNASPASFKAAIDVLSTLPGKRIIALGDMGELGSAAQQAHKELGCYAKQKGIEYFFACGDLSRFAVESFADKNAIFSSERNELAKQIIPMLNKNTTVLVKGSRSAGMDKLVQQLINKEE